MISSGGTQLADLLKDYYVGTKLGAGARTEIYEIKHRRDGHVLAVKYVAVREEEDLRVIGHLGNEFNVLTRLHANSSPLSRMIVNPVALRKVRRLFRLRAAYLVMERVYGRSLFDFSDYTIEQVLTVFRRLCAALEHIHNCGFVHADLKPHNIMVDEKLQIKLIDFGFAAPIGQELKGNKGTFGYLAPEQAAGRLGERTDVFNLGAALYRVLTGQNVPSIMPGDHEARGFVPDERINIAPLYRINPNVPQELSDMVIRCCSPSEHERPTASQLKQYLHGLQMRMGYGAVKQ